MAGDGARITDDLPSWAGAELRLRAWASRHRRPLVVVLSTLAHVLIVLPMMAAVPVGWRKR